MCLGSWLLSLPHVPADAPWVDDVYLATPGKVGWRPSLHAWELARQVLGFDFGPITVEIGHLERNHLILLPLRHIDLLQHEIRSAEAEAGQAVVLPELLETEGDEKLERQFELRT